YRRYRRSPYRRSYTPDRRRSRSPSSSRSPPPRKRQRSSSLSSYSSRRYFLKKLLNGVVVMIQEVHPHVEIQKFQKRNDFNKCIFQIAPSIALVIISFMNIYSLIVYRLRIHVT